MDVKGADADKVKTQMQERSIASEDWGGEIVTVPISALKGDNVDDLLDMILLQAELMELKANPDAVTEGVVVEARQEIGRGATAVVIVQKGTLKVGDSIHCGSVYCKVKAMIDDQKGIKSSQPPSTPVNILGWSEVPEAGAIFKGAKNERTARKGIRRVSIKRESSWTLWFRKRNKRAKFPASMLFCRNIQEQENFLPGYPQDRRSWLFGGFGRIAWHDRE